MREGWKELSLGEIAVRMADGPFGSNLKAEHYTNEKQVRIIQLSNIGEEGWREDNVKYTTFDHLRSISRSEVFPNDIVIAKMMPAGRSIICPNHEAKFVLSSDAVKVELKEGYNHFFINYSINSPYFREQVYENVSGSGRVRTSLTKLRDCKLRIPSINEQQRIVTFLDTEFAKIDALKAKAEQSLQNAKDLFQAALKEEMTPKEETPMRHIGETFKSFSGGTPIKSNKEYYNKGNIPWLRSGEVCKKYINETEMFITEAGLKNSSAKYYPVNTVVIAMYGATAAQVGILKIEATSNQAVCGLLPNDSYLPEYVYYWFSAIQKDLAAQAQGGAQPNISQEKIKKVLIPIMNIEEQEAIVARLDTLRTLVSSLEQKYSKIAAECDALKQAILKQVFE